MDPVSTKLSNLGQRAQNCTMCRLCENRTNAVPGSGNPHAEVVFVGEAPGKKEDLTGEPFCGASGKMLDSMLESIQMDRSDIFITNIVKCRPAANRDPLEDEKLICATSYLDVQLKLINPKLIVTLGRHALNHFIPNLKISEVHGQPKRYNSRVYLALYHPAAALYNGSLRETLLEDFQTIPKILDSLH